MRELHEQWEWLHVTLSKNRDGLKVELRDVVDHLIERLENQAGAAPPVAARQ